MNKRDADRIGKEDDNSFIRDVKLRDPSDAAAFAYLYPGLGQILNGQLLKGFALIGMASFTVIFALIRAVVSGWEFLLLLLCLPILWVYGVWDAYAYAKKYNEKVASSSGGIELDGWSEHRK